MKRFTIILAVVALAVFTSLSLSVRAPLARTPRPAAAASPQATGNCGCSIACGEYGNCSIGCPTGTAAHCECPGRGQFGSRRPRCYCGK